MNMGQQVMGSITETAKMATFATPELRGLFEEWTKVVEGEILGLLKDKGLSHPSEIAAKLKLSEESVLFLIGMMAREGRLKIKEVTL